MTQTSLFEKRKKLEQRKNRLKQLDSVLKIQERKQRTRRLITLGGLVSKANLDTWNTNALLGGLLFLKEQEDDAIQVDAWARKGGALFHQEKASSQPFQTREENG